jgi:hypothetical protein
MHASAASANSTPWPSLDSQGLQGRQLTELVWQAAQAVVAQPAARAFRQAVGAMGEEAGLCRVS